MLDLDRTRLETLKRRDAWDSISLGNADTGGLDTDTSDSRFRYDYVRLLYSTPLISVIQDQQKQLRVSD
jgi:hypothetical protein